LKILIAHNRYQQMGGEDFVVENESHLLADRGHEVRLFQAHNDHIQGTRARVAAAVDSVYSRSSKQRLLQTLGDFRPDIVHIHNLFPTLSSSILGACDETGTPFVRTLHNYRLVCPKGILYRDGHVCEDCLRKDFAWPGIQHACYRDSRPGTLAVALSTRRERHTLTASTAKRHLIVLTEFADRKFAQASFPNVQTHIKPNFLSTDPGVGPGDGGYFLYLGRLVQEKGIEPLLEAWRGAPAHLRLKIAGTGPLESLCKGAADTDPRIEFLGHVPRAEVQALIHGASAMIFPSVWYEGFPMSVVESLAAGTPVIASKIGSMEDIILHGETGLHFEPGNAASLREQLNRFALDHNLQARMRLGARADFVAKYTAETNYVRLLEIYLEVIRAQTRLAELPSGGAQRSAIASASVK
jgi:glycosyltransferase involved in cell wall biosynthesis